MTELKQVISSGFKYGTEFNRIVWNSTLTKEIPADTHPYMVKAERALQQATVKFEVVMQAFQTDNLDEVGLAYFMSDVQKNLEISAEAYNKYVALKQSEKAKKEQDATYESPISKYPYTLNYRTEFKETKAQVDQVFEMHDLNNL